MDAFREAVVRVAVKAGYDAEAAREAVTVPKERDRGDLTLPCFRLGKPPHEAAKKVVEAFEADAWLASAEAAGPFVNFRLDRAGFTKRTLAAVGPDYGRARETRGSVVIDYGSPNIAKPLLFHHLRSAVIGQALCNLHRWSGYEVTGLNYLGDVGTAFGKLMVGIEKHGEAGDADTLNARYVEAARMCADDPALMDRAREWAKRLEDDDPEALRLWKRAREISLKGFAEVYDWLGIRHDVVDGEQMYVKRAAALADDLLDKGKARVSEGAVVLDASDEALGVLLLKKSDGATLYQTRDLAAAIDRWERFRFERMLYVTDIAQEHHFKQLFSGLSALGFEWAARCRHVIFGQVLMGGKRTATREGRGVLLHDVLEEGRRRALEVVEQKNPDLDDKERIARSVGAAAVIFSDVGYPVRKNINFDWEEILSFDGRTGPYLQYVHASASSILRKGEGSGDGDPGLLEHDLEWDLVRRIAEFPDAVARACEECEPSLLAGHLYELGREFRSYHTAGARDPGLRVLTEDSGLRAARLGLVGAVRQTLATGLTLLGIEPLDVM